jgi:multiple antibiotic resistance protein
MNMDIFQKRIYPNSPDTPHSGKEWQLMMTLIQAIFFAFAALFPIVNPLGASIVFLSLIKGSSTQQINSLALKISVYVIAMLLIVLFVGSLLLNIFGVTVPIVLISGGLLLTHVGWQMLNKPNEESTEHPFSSNRGINMSHIEKIEDPRAFYPLTLPVTAGPTCIAVTIAIGAHGAHSNWEIRLLTTLGHSIGIVLIGVTVFFCYRYSHYIFDKLKDAGKNVVMCLAAFINICIGLQITWHGLSMLIS